MKDNELIQKLPMASQINQFLKDLLENKTPILDAPTGSGKSVLIILGMLMVGERSPKFNTKVSTWVAVPTRTATENMKSSIKHFDNKRLRSMGTAHSGEIHYNRRRHSVIVATTQHITNVLLKMLGESLISGNFTIFDTQIVLVDEAHFPLMETNLLLSVLPIIKTFCPSFRYGLASATHEQTYNIEAYGNNIITAPIRQFGVEIKYLNDLGIKYDFERSKQGDDKRNKQIIDLLHKHCAKDGDVGDIIVFLPGKKEIENIIENPIIKNLILTQSHRIMVLSGHGDMDQETSNKILAPHDPTKIRIVLATNALEASVTVDGCSLIIDSCLQRAIMPSPDSSGLIFKEVLSLMYSSIVSMEQRSGRTGRTRDGQVYRLITEEKYKSAVVYDPSDYDDEIVLRTNVHPLSFIFPTSFVLQMIDVKVPPSLVLKMFPQERYLYEMGELTKIGMLGIVPNNCRHKILEPFGIDINDTKSMTKKGDHDKIEFQLSYLNTDLHLDVTQLGRRVVRCHLPIKSAVAILIAQDKAEQTNNDYTDESISFDNQVVLAMIIFMVSVIEGANHSMLYIPEDLKGKNGLISEQLKQYTDETDLLVWMKIFVDFLMQRDTNSDLSDPYQGLYWFCCKRQEKCRVLNNKSWREMFSTMVQIVSHVNGRRMKGGEVADWIRTRLYSAYNKNLNLSTTKINSTITVQKKYIRQTAQILVEAGNTVHQSNNTEYWREITDDVMIRKTSRCFNTSYVASLHKMKRETVTIVTLEPFTTKNFEGSLVHSCRQNLIVEIQSEKKKHADDPYFGFKSMIKTRETAESQLSAPSIYGLFEN
jgi:superfamily II DNA/RNA helicase